MGSPFFPPKQIITLYVFNTDLKVGKNSQPYVWSVQKPLFIALIYVFK